MAMTTLPTGQLIKYNQCKFGITGELGEGANAKIRFLETVITRDDLDSITMISSIPGSETWDVRDLFQRDVDHERVTKDILPYFKDKSKVKFFNPLTLILLPMDSSGREVIKDVEFIDKITNEGDPAIKEAYEKSGFYKFSLFDHPEPLGKVEWNSKNCFLVAIDGQHRLSALKRWKDEPSGTFGDWKIPVVILNIFKTSPNSSTANLLEIVRKTFVYINTKAERVNKAREILLNDESVNAICTQELIQCAHENDHKPLNKRDKSIIPLIFFDWQGKVVNKIHVEGPASVKSIEEIHAWFDEYILDDDGSDYQASELMLDDLTPPLEGFGTKASLTHDDAKIIREQFRKIVLPGVLHFLQNFTPYKKYIFECRKTEEDAINRSDNAQHAFMKLRFGSHNAPTDQRDAVDTEFQNLTKKFCQLKDNFLPFAIKMDIGMRGIVYAFSQSRYEYQQIKNETITWLDFSKMFTIIVNGLNEEGWFESFDNLSNPKKEFLTNLVYDEAGSIVNYKIQQAREGLGAILVIIVMSNLLKDRKIENEEFEHIWGDYSTTVRKTYEKGLRRYHKSRLQPTWSGTIAEFNNEVKRQAEKDSEKRLTKFRKFLNVD